MSKTKEAGVVLPPPGKRVAVRLPTLPARGKLYAVATRKLGHKAVAVAVEWDSSYDSGDSGAGGAGAGPAAGPLLPRRGGDGGAGTLARPAPLPASHLHTRTSGENRPGVGGVCAHLSQVQTQTDCFHHHPVLQAGYTEPQLPHPVLNVRRSGGDELQHGAHHAGRPHGDALLSLTQGTNTITIKLNR